MLDFFKKDNKKHQKQMELLENLAKKEKIFKVFIQKGLLSYNPDSRRLFIATQLAQIYLGNAKKWQSFLSSVHQWALYHRQQEKWNQYFQSVEISAVREAKKKYAVLSEAEIRSIRQKARNGVNLSDVETPNVEPFEFFIADIEQTSDDSEIIAVGHFDGHNFEMEKFENVQRFLQKK